MDYEPGPLDPLDRTMLGAMLASSVADGLAGDLVASSAPLADHVAALDGVTSDAVFGATPDLTPADGNDLVDVASSADDLVNSGFGQPDPSIVGSADAHAQATQDVHDQMVDAPDFAHMTFPTVPGNPGDTYDPGQKDPPPQS